jgi:two-component sensor histidine kinase
MVFDIFKCSDGTCFVATQNKGIAQWDLKTNRFQAFDASSKIGQVSNTIYDITEDNNNNLWIASRGGLIQLNRSTNQVSYKEQGSLLVSKKLYGIIKLKNADSLFIAGEFGPAFFSLKDQQWKPFPANPRWNTAFVGRYIYEGENSTLWICTVGDGLASYNYSKNEFVIKEAVKHISVYVRHLLEDKGIFWLATDNGIILYDHAKDKVIRHFRLGNADQSNVCYAVQKDNQGFFWVSTNSGLYRINPNNFNARHYNLGNGLSFLEYNTACTLKPDHNTLLFGGVGGITRFNPEFLKENTFSPNPLITAINVNDSPWQFKLHSSNSDQLQLNHKDNFITIFFAVTNFSNHNNNQFSYRLKGLTDSWTNCGNRNFANYTSLPPGNYTFQLKSANSDGKWCEGITTLGFRIFPPWWQRWWFIAIAVLIFAGLLTYFIRRRINSIKSEANLKQKISETEMMALRAQMNPHFIFNSLNSIREMILNNENKEASHFLSKFAHLIRITLDQSAQPFISLRNTIDYLHRYVEMEQVRNADFTCRILADDELDLDETELPPMLIQPFVENAIWHGVTSNEKNINITIDFKKENHQLACIIADNGIGINEALKIKRNGHNLHKSVGIENIHNRIRLLNEKYNLKSSITVRDRKDVPGEEGRGTIVTLRIPLEIYQS